MYFIILYTVIFGHVGQFFTCSGPKSPPWFPSMVCPYHCIWYMCYVFIYYFHYEIVCNCWNKFKKRSANLWFYAFQIIPKRDKNIETDSLSDLTRVSFLVLWSWHRFCFLCNVPKLKPSDNVRFVPEVDLNTEHVFHDMSENHTTSRLQTMLFHDNTEFINSWRRSYDSWNITSNLCLSPRMRNWFSPVTKCTQNKFVGEKKCFWPAVVRRCSPASSIMSRLLQYNWNIVECRVKRP